MSTTAFRLATALYRSGCLKFGNFKIKSGASSPYYVDLTGLLSSPRNFRMIVEIAANEIRKIMSNDRIDKLASIELKGALILPSIASELDIPCMVVRKKEKSYGVKGRVTGAEAMKGDRILFFDDVISEGLSKFEGIRPLEQLGTIVGHILVVVDREQDGRQNLEKAGYKVYALSKISELVDSLESAGSISQEKARTVLNYIQSRPRSCNTDV